MQKYVVMHGVILWYTTINSHKIPVMPYYSPTIPLFQCALFDPSQSGLLARSQVKCMYLFTL